MRPHRTAAGTVLMRQGEHGEGDCSMALILSGEVTVEGVSASEDLVVSVLGPGSLIGELGLIDQAARSATCTAASDLALAVLTREAFEQLMAEQPAVAARLLLAITQRVAGHLRETNRKLLALTRVTKALKQELDAAHASIGACCSGSTRRRRPPPGRAPERRLRLQQHRFVGQLVGGLRRAATGGGNRAASRADTSSTACDRPCSTSPACRLLPRRSASACQAAGSTARATPRSATTSMACSASSR
jgi:CRP-like cAMP-binding protein